MTSAISNSLGGAAGSIRAQEAVERRSVRKEDSNRATTKQSDAVVTPFESRSKLEGLDSAFKLAESLGDRIRRRGAEAVDVQAPRDASVVSLLLDGAEEVEAAVI